MSSQWLWFLASAVAVVVLVVLLTCLGQSHLDEAGKPLLVYCGAGIRAPVEAAAKDYERDYGVRFVFQYGPSQTLLVQAELSK